MAAILWEYSQVAVPIFIFCSSYLYFSKTAKEHFSFAYFWKRIKRLVMPYYAYLLVLWLYHLLLKQATLSFENIGKKILFLNSSSRDLDWLVVLFLYFMILMPLIRLMNRKPIIIWLYSFLSAASAFVLLYIDVPIAFRLIMWLPWSLILIITYFIVQHEKKPIFLLLLTMGSFLLYGLSTMILIQNDATLILTENKYPPNMFYLSYGIWSMLTLYLLHKMYGRYLLAVQPLFDFFSKHSYSIFFIHFLVLYVFLDFTEYRKLPWWGLWMVVLLLTVTVQIAINQIRTVIYARY